MGCDNKEKMKTKTTLKKLIIVCGQHYLDQQAIVQTGLKLRVVYNTNTKVYACGMKVESFSESEISPCRF